MRRHALMRCVAARQTLYDDALAVRISFQKVFTSAFTIVNARKRLEEASAAFPPADDGEEALAKLAALNERLFDLRQVRERRPERPQVCKPLIASHCRRSPSQALSVSGSGSALAMNLQRERLRNIG